MKPTPNSQRDPVRQAQGRLAPLLSFGAHPDDIEFGCGGVIANETRRGRAAHFVVCSMGESGSNGNPQQRGQEAAASAKLLGAEIEFVAMGGDAHFEHSLKTAYLFASILRRQRPGIVLAPAPVQNQHPDHAVLGRLVQDAARLARYGGIKELSDSPPHVIDQLLFYAVSIEGEPKDISPVLIDVSDPQTLHTWTSAMEAHASQMETRNYLDLQLTRAKLNGLRAGVEYAIALYPSDPIVVDSLDHLGHGARRF